MNKSMLPWAAAGFLIFGGLAYSFQYDMLLGALLVIIGLANLFVALK